MKLLSPRRFKQARQQAPGRSADYFNRLADDARDAGKFLVASVFYEEVLKRSPGNAAIHVQCGHMKKEAGDLEAAGHHYRKAEALVPDDPELQLQLGHYYKVAGQPREALKAYARAIVLMPEWELPQDELSALNAHMLAEAGNGAARNPSDTQNAAAEASPAVQDADPLHSLRVRRER